MKKVIFMTVLMVFGLALFSGCATMTGETAGENIDDSTIHSKVSAIVITNQFISKASLWYTMRHERNRWEETEA